MRSGCCARAPSQLSPGLAWPGLNWPELAWRFKSVCAKLASSTQLRRAYQSPVIEAPALLLLPGSRTPSTVTSTSPPLLLHIGFSHALTLSASTSVHRSDPNCTWSRTRLVQLGRPRHPLLLHPPTIAHDRRGLHRIPLDIERRPSALLGLAFDPVLRLASRLPLLAAPTQASTALAALLDLRFKRCTARCTLHHALRIQERALVRKAKG